MPAANRIVFAAAPYANSAPLLYGLLAEPRVNVFYAPPSRLGSYLERKEVDVALVPVVQWFENPAWQRIEGLGVASLGPVCSVVLRCNVPPELIKTIGYDPASNTSNLLAKWILKRRFNRDVVQVSVLEADAEVVIGDRALDVPVAKYGNIDLSQAWFEETQLPFVFAVWAVRAHFRGIDLLSEFAHNSYEQGGRALDQIAKKWSGTTRHSFSFWMDYLTRSIHYKLTSSDVEGMERFRKIIQSEDEAFLG